MRSHCLFAVAFLLAGVARAEPVPIASSRPADKGSEFGTQRTTNGGDVVRPEGETMPAGPADPRVPAVVGDFGFDVYRRLAAGDAGTNVFCSPYSLFCALTMCAEGASGETAAEMGQMLRLHRGSQPHVGIAELNKRLRGKWAGLLAPAGHDLRVANALWVDRTCPLRKGFVDVMTKYHEGGVYGVDFRHDAPGAYARINAWAEKQTEGRIKDLIPTRSPPARLVITNAIYFKGKWKEPFMQRETTKEAFWTRDKRQFDVMTMTREGMKAARYGAFNADGTFFATPRSLPSNAGDESRYPGERGFAVLEMPYKGDELSMVVVVPRSIDGLDRVEASLTSANVGAWLRQLEARDVHVHVPKFTMRGEYEMKPQLQAMGMKRAFREPGPDGAQFENATASQKPEDKLYVGAVRHKTFVEVCEQGTEAAAVTGITMLYATAVPHDWPREEPFTPTFRADRAFVFLIRDVKTGAVLFVGRVCRPGIG